MTGVALFACGSTAAAAPSADAAKTPKCGGKKVTKKGTRKADRIKGTRKADVIAGLGGKDTIKGLRGNDTVCGGAGNDRLLGNGGRDTLIGGKGRDTCLGGPGRDRIRSCEAGDGFVDAVYVRPTVTTSAGSAAWVEGAGPVPFDNGLTVSDLDSLALQSATVRIGANHVPGQDTLGFTNQLGITGTYDSGTGVLALTGTAPVADYQTALRSVTYGNGSDTPSTATRTLTVQVTDQTSLPSNTGTRDLTLGATNDAPAVTTSAGSLAYAEGDFDQVIDPALTVSDPDDANLESATVSVSAGFDSAKDGLGFVDQLGITGSFDSSTGVLTLTGPAPAADFQTALRSVRLSTLATEGASRTIEFRVNDGDADSAPATKEVAVGPPNAAPVVDTTDTNLAYAENDPPTAVDPGVTVTDPDSDQSGASVLISGNYDSSQDVLAFTNQNGISGSWDSAAGELTLTGTASPADYQTALRSVTYQNTSDGPTNLQRTVLFQTTDTHGADSTQADRTIDITPENDPPTAVDDTGQTDEDSVLNVGAPGVLGNDTDPDPGDTKTVSKLDGVALSGGTQTGPTTGGGSVTINSDGSYSYDPGTAFDSLATGESDADSFQYTMEDTDGAPSTATVNITVDGVSDAPVASDDAYDVVGNTDLFVGTTKPAGEAGKEITGSLLDNDSDPDSDDADLNVQPQSNAATAASGRVDVNADGTFTYHPQAGDTGADAFNYRVCDSSPCNSGTVANTIGTVNITLTGEVWYVKNDATLGGDGTSDTPFDTLLEAETASGAGNTVFVYEGDGTSSGYDTGFAMTANQRLIGEANGLTIDPDGGGSLGTVTLRDPVADAYPALTANGEDVVDLDDGNEVRAFTLDPQGAGGGIFGGSGDNNGTVADVRVVDTGTAGTQPGIELDGTTGTFNFQDLTVSTDGATAVRLNNAGTARFASTGTISLTASGAKGLDATGTSMGPGSFFDDITVTGSSSGGVSMSNTTGTTTLGDGSGTDLQLTTTSGATPAFQLANAGTVSVPAGGTANISATGGPAVDVSGTSGAALALDTVTSTSSSGRGINLDGLGSGTFSASGGSIGGATLVAFRVNGGSGDVTYPGDLNNGVGDSASVTGRTGGIVTLSGNIGDTADAGGGVSVTGNSGGSTVLSGGTKTLDTGASGGVVFDTSDGHTLTLSGGGLGITTSSGNGLAATNSGTLVVSGSGNTIGTGNGRGLNVSATDIGASGLTFQSIASNGSVNGISLNGTGSAGSLTVTGGGSAVLGGDNSGGTIQNTTGPAISLAGTTGPSFRNMRILNTGDSGINGTGVDGFTFKDGKIDAAGDADDENSITFDDNVATANVTGAVTITNNIISDTEAAGVDIQNSTGTITDANISGNTLDDTGDVLTAGSAVSLVALGGASAAANVTKAELSNNTISDFRAGAGFVVQGGNGTNGGPAGKVGTAGSGTDVIAITGNFMNGGNGGIGNQPDRFVTANVHGVGQGNFDVSGNGSAGNRIRNIDCIAIELEADGPVTLTSKVQNNFINPGSAVGCAGIAVGTDQQFAVTDAGTHTATISGNNVMGTDGPGIYPIVRNSASTMNVKVQNNTVAAPSATNAARAGIRVDSGSASGDTTLCLNISGNTTAGSTNTGTSTTSPGINLRKQGTVSTVNEFAINGMAATGSPGVENYVNGLNTSTSGTFGTGGTALLSATTGFTNCSLP